MIEELYCTECLSYTLECNKNSAKFSSKIEMLWPVMWMQQALKLVATQSNIFTLKKHMYGIYDHHHLLLLLQYSFPFEH